MKKTLLHLAILLLCLLGISLLLALIPGSIDPNGKVYSHTYNQAHGQAAFEQSASVGSLREQFEARARENQSTRNLLLQQYSSTGNSNTGTSSHDSEFDQSPNVLVELPFASSSISSTASSSDRYATILTHRKNRILGRLQLVLSNLIQIRGRIESRIVKNVQSGIDMSGAEALLVVADGKIADAQTIIEMNATNNTDWASSTPQIYRNTRQAIADAHDALQAVIRSIATSMGVSVE